MNILYLAAPGKRVQLKSVPTLKKWNFNKDGHFFLTFLSTIIFVSDIDELVASLSECPGVMHRPSKLRKIFASNACRKSVMFGDPLSVQKMEEVQRRNVYGFLYLYIRSCCTWERWTNHGYWHL
jgi:DNA mismatch repair protein PMS2